MHGPHFRSSKYPIGCEGKSCAAMPYAMFFYNSYAIHASNDVPGRNASHGCIRVLREDAKWLNQEFVEVGTKVIVNSYEKNIE